MRAGACGKVKTKRRPHPHKTYIHPPHTSIFVTHMLICTVHALLPIGWSAGCLILYDVFGYQDISFTVYWGEFKCFYHREVW